jgi:hypothetical protein
VSFAAITLCVAFQRVIPQVIGSVRKLLDTLSYLLTLRSIFSFSDISLATGNLFS